MSSSRPRVSILLVTYNHELFIDRALASIESQRVGFDVEVVVADDSSTDATLSILAEWAERSQFTVRILPPQPRLGITLNYARGFAACHGHYIAVLEGDDEWLSTEKVRRAAEHLDAHPDHSMVANRILLRDERDGFATVIPAIGMAGFEGEVNVRRLAEVNWFATFSACTYRADALERVPPAVFEATSFDWMINLSVMAFGVAGFLTEVMTLYRQHGGGEWSRGSHQEREQRIRDLLPGYIDMASPELRPELTRVMHDVEGRLLAIAQAGDQPAVERDRNSWTPPIPRIDGGRIPRVSVVMASYNHARWIEESIASVLDQTMSDLELIIVDDASTDRTLEIAARFDDPRIRLYHLEHNHGGAGALNFAIQQTQAEFIAVINSDDAWEPHKLARQLEVIDDQPELGAVFTAARLVDEKSAPLRPAFIPSWHRIFSQPDRSQAQWLRFFFEKGNALCHPSVLIRREVYTRLGLYDNRMRQIPDLDQWIRLVKHWPIRVLGDEDLVRFRVLTTQQNASAVNPTNVVRGMNEHLAIAERFFDDCSDDMLTEAFGDVMIDPHIRWPDQRECEIALLWWNLDCAMRDVNRTHAVAELRRLLGDENIALLLRSRYNINELSLHDLAGRVAEASFATGGWSPSLVEPWSDPRLGETPSGALAGEILRRMRRLPPHKWPGRVARAIRSRGQ
ncbi:MAG: glycosyltransferase [Pseudolysinimonas sp.]